MGLFQDSSDDIPVSSATCMSYCDRNQNVRVLLFWSFTFASFYIFWIRTSLSGFGWEVDWYCRYDWSVLWCDISNSFLNVAVVLLVVSAGGVKVSEKFEEDHIFSKDSKTSAIDAAKKTAPAMPVKVTCPLFFEDPGRCHDNCTDCINHVQDAYERLVSQDCARTQTKGQRRTPFPNIFQCWTKLNYFCENLNSSLIVVFVWHDQKFLFFEQILVVLLVKVCVPGNLRGPQ